MSVALIFAALIAGLVGSGHCIGMCGPIVGLFESAPSVRLSPLRRRMSYHAGRILFYASLGLLAGALGTAAAASMPVKTAGFVLRLLASLALLLLGVRLLLGKGRLAALDRIGQAFWQRISPLARYVLPMDNTAKALATGFIWGALPCGLVYSMLAMAAVSGSALNGAMLMVAFGAGTLPTLAIAGAGASHAWHTRFRKTFGIAMIVFACVSLGLLWRPHGMPSDADMATPATATHHATH